MGASPTYLEGVRGIQGFINFILDVCFFLKKE
jgi:hypothetical protein